MYVHTVYIYIYRERERGGEREIPYPHIEPTTSFKHFDDTVLSEKGVDIPIISLWTGGEGSQKPLGTTY